MGLAEGLASLGISGGTGGGSGTVTSVTSSDNTLAVATGTTTPDLTQGSALTSALAAKAPLASPTFTGTTTIPAGIIGGSRITKRILPLSANSATPAINSDLYDVVHITAQTAAITSFTSGLTGTPVDGDTLRISVTGTGAVAFTWGTSFEASTVALPTTTVTTARLDIGFLWNTETTKWRCVAVA